MENAKHRITLAERSAQILAAFTALTALPAGLALAARPDGSLIGLPPALLAGSPFSSYRVPGLLLAGLVGASALVAFLAVRARHARAPLAVLAAGLVETGWIIGQLLLLGYLGFLQPLILGVGAAQIAVAFRLRGSGIRPGNR